MIVTAVVQALWLEYHYTNAHQLLFAERKIVHYPFTNSQSKQASC